MKKIMLLLLVVITSLGLSAQSTQNVTIQTNGKCGRCAKVMQTAVPTFEGVQACSYDMATAKLTVSYDPKLTTADAIRKGVSKLGYDADKVKADAEARAKLPACCRGEAQCGGEAKAGEHKCSGHAQAGEHKCAGEAKAGEHKCAGHAQASEHKCANAQGGEHKCAGEAKASGQKCCGDAKAGEHKCANAQGGEHKCAGHK
ncbi:MAG: cation transporter [Bacteroidales bacterium]|nr:cation transporter [Bacteroidales bacterium]